MQFGIRLQRIAYSNVRPESTTKIVPLTFQSSGNSIEWPQIGAGARTLLMYPHLKILILLYLLESCSGSKNQKMYL